MNILGLYKFMCGFDIPINLCVDTTHFFIGLFLLKKSEKQKFACEILGKPMITHIVNACKEAGLDKIVVLLVIKGSISKIYLVQLFNMLFKMNN